MSLKVLGFAAVVGHALARRPPKPSRVVLDAAGRVAVPDLGLADLALGPRTRFTPRWVRFDVTSPEGRFDVVLLADQLEPAAWSELQARLRGFRGAEGNEGR